MATLSLVNQCLPNRLKIVKGLFCLSGSGTKNTNGVLCLMGKDGTKPPNRIREIRASRGMTLEALSSASGLSVGYIQRMEKGERQLSVKNIVRIAEALQVQDRELLNDDGSSSTISVLGYVGLGEEIEWHGEDQVLDEVEVYGLSSTSNLAALFARGTSMMPRINEGDVIVYRRNGKTANDMLGREAVVKVVDGPYLLKKIRRGYEPGLFNLESHNAPLRENANIEWVGELASIIPEGSWRKVTK